MNAKDLIKAGMIPEARKRLTDEVKSSPGDVAKRVLLFQVLAFCGEWDRAERHLDAIGAQDASAETGVHVYKNQDVIRLTHFQSLTDPATSLAGRWQMIEY